MTTPLAGLANNFDEPDTIASLRGGGPLTFNDDHNAGSNVPAGDSLGSLWRLQAPGSGTFHIGVSGTGGEQFDGSASGSGHVETGRYALTTARIGAGVPGGDFGDGIGNQTTGGADPIAIGRG